MGDSLHMINRRTVTKGIMGALKSGEGLVFEFTGPGRVWAQTRNPGELMMSCAVCGVHIPASDAVFAHGKVFCGPEHRDTDASRREAGG